LHCLVVKQKLPRLYGITVLGSTAAAFLLLGIFFGLIFSGVGSTINQYYDSAYKTIQNPINPSKSHEYPIDLHWKSVVFSVLAALRRSWTHRPSRDHTIYDHNGRWEYQGLNTIAVLFLKISNRLKISNSCIAIDIQYCTSCTSWRYLAFMLVEHVGPLLNDSMIQNQ